MSRRWISLVALSLSTSVACTQGDAPGEDQSPVDHSDLGVTDAQIRAVLALANLSSFDALLNDVELEPEVADAIVVHRDGPDGVVGNGDDDPYDDLEELDAIDGLGAEAFSRM